MTPIAVIEIDALLKLVDAFRLTANEIAILEKDGHNPDEAEGYYLAAQQTLAWRTAYNAQAKQQLTRLNGLALMDGYDLPPISTHVPEVSVPIFGIGL